MPFPTDWRPVRRGQRGISSRSINPLGEQLEILSRHTAGAAGVEGQTPFIPLDNDATDLLVRITSVAVASGPSPSAYNWLAVRSQDESGEQLYVDAPDIGRGILGSYEAYESNSKLDVPVDGSAVVVLKPGAASEFFVFTWGETATWAKIDGGLGPCYDWHQVYPGDSPDCTNNWNDLPGGYSGTETQNPLREWQAVTGIKPGTIVRIYRGHCTGYPHVFVTQLQAGDGSTQGEIQALEVNNAVGGTYTLYIFSADGSQYGATTLDYNAGAFEVQNALNAIAGQFTVPYTVAVTGIGTTDNPFVLTYPPYDAYPLLGFDYSGLLDDQEWLFSATAESITEKCEGILDTIPATFVQCEPAGAKNGLLVEYSQDHMILTIDGCLRALHGPLVRKIVACADCTCIDQGSGPTPISGSGPSGPTLICYGVPCQFCLPTTTPTGYTFTAAGFIGCGAGKGTVTVPCCPNPVSTVLHLVFTGGLAPLNNGLILPSNLAYTGGVPIQSAAGNSWDETVASQDGTITKAAIRFFCDSPGTGRFVLEIVATFHDGTECTFIAAAFAQCNPFVWSVGAFNSSCTGPYTPPPSTAQVNDGDAPGNVNGPWILIQDTTNPCRWIAYNPQTQIQAVLTESTDQLSGAVIYVFQFIDARPGHNTPIVTYIYKTSSDIIDCTQMIVATLDVPDYCQSAPRTLTFLPAYNCPPEGSVGSGSVASGSGKASGGVNVGCRTAHNDLCATFSGALAPLLTVRLKWTGGLGDQYVSDPVTACGMTAVINFVCVLSDAGVTYEMSSAFFTEPIGASPDVPIAPFTWSYPDDGSAISAAPGCPGHFGAAVVECA
jgi:hypothetical protein